LNICVFIQIPLVHIINKYLPVLQFVPLLVEECVRSIEENGLHHKGIYRVPGNTAAITSLQADIEKVICWF